MKTYKLENDVGDTRTLTAPNIIEAIKLFNSFKARHGDTKWALVMGTLDKFPSLGGVK